MKKKQFFIFYDGELYRIRYETKKPVKRDILLCSFFVKFGDVNRKAMLFEKDDERVICFNPLNKTDQPIGSETVITPGRNETFTDKMAHYIMGISQDEIRELPVVWFVELYDGGNMIIPEKSLIIK